MEGEEIKDEEEGDPLAEDDEGGREVHPRDLEEDFDIGGLFSSDGEEEHERGEERPSGSAEGVEPPATKDGEVPAKLDDLHPPEMTSVMWAVALPDNKSRTILEAVQDAVHHAKADLEGQVHVGCVHQLRRGVPFAYDPRRWHCVTEWRKRRAVLVAYSSGVWKSVNQENRKKLEAAGFPIFSMEEG